jgi:hypothetical protein
VDTTVDNTFFVRADTQLLKSVAEKESLMHYKFVQLQYSLDSMQTWQNKCFISRAKNLNNGDTVTTGVNKNKKSQTGKLQSQANPDFWDHRINCLKTMPKCIHKTKITAVITNLKIIWTEKNDSLPVHYCRRTFSSFLIAFVSIKNKKYYIHHNFKTKPGCFICVCLRAGNVMYKKYFLLLLNIK